MWPGLLGGLALGAFGYKGTKDQNIASAEQAQKQMAFQERMSNTAHQRQMADMRKAGLNPILSAKYGGASSPPGQQAPMQNKAAVALQNAASAANIENIMANTAKTREEARKIAFQADIGDFGSTAMDWTLDSTAKSQALAKQYFRKSNWFNPDNYGPFFSTAREASRAYKPMSKTHLKRLINESDIPFKDRHRAAQNADIRFKRNRKFEKRKIKLIKSKHLRNRGRR